MYIPIVHRHVGVFLLIATVVKSEWMQTTESRNSWPTDKINIGCAEVRQSFDTVTCNIGFAISVINAHYGYFNKSITQSCPPAPSDCFVSVPLNSSTYYNDILKWCNKKTQCDGNLKAEMFQTTSCGRPRAGNKRNNDYVSIQYYCVPLTATIETISLCSKTISHGIINCTGNGSVHVVGAILGFEPGVNSSCIPGEDRCRIQPDVDHLQHIHCSCEGMQECQVYAATSTNRTTHTCDQLNYTFENITYYCKQDSGIPFTRSSECASNAITSVAYSSLSTSAATLVDASTYTMVDDLLNVSTVITDVSPTDDITAIIVGSVVGSVVLIIILLVLVFIVWRKRNAEDTSKRLGDDANHEPNGFTQIDEAALVQSNTPQDATHWSQIYGVAPLSDTTGMATDPPHNYPNTAKSAIVGLYALAQYPPHTNVYSNAQESSTDRESSANCRSETEDTTLYSLARESNTENRSPNTAIYVNVTEPNRAVYSLVRKTDASLYQPTRVGEPVGSAYSGEEPSEIRRVNIDPRRQRSYDLSGSQSAAGPQDLVLIDNSLYSATES